MRSANRLALLDIITPQGFIEPTNAESLLLFNSMEIYATNVRIMIYRREACRLRKFRLQISDFSSRRSNKSLLNRLS